MLPCLRCDKMFAGEGKYCPDCRNKKVVKTKETKKSKPVKMVVVELAECLYCHKEFEPKFKGYDRSYYCDECREKRVWARSFNESLYTHR